MSNASTCHPKCQQVKSLLAEKKQLQARLTELNKQLRDLDVQHPGLSVCARNDLNLEPPAPSHRTLCSASACAVLA